MSGILFKNAVLLDCTGAEPREKAWVLVENGLIKAVGTGRAPASKNADVVDCGGRWLLLPSGLQGL